MAEVGQVSFYDRYVMARDAEEHVRHVAIPFIAEHLGDQAIKAIERKWDDGLQTIPRNAAPGQEYEVAYSNWIWTLKTTYDLVRQRTDEEGVRMFQEAQIESLRSDKSSLGLSLKLMRVFAQGTAFKTTARDAVRSLEWLAPFAIVELTSERVVFDTENCKVLEYDGAEDICKHTCRAMCIAQFSKCGEITMDVERQGTGCTHTVTRVH